MLAIIATLTPTLITTPTQHPHHSTRAGADQPAAHAVASPDGLAELLADRGWAATRPARQLPATTPASASPNATPAAAPAAEVVRETSSRRAPARKPAARSAVRTIADTGSAAATVVAYVLAQIGKPYRFATAGPDTFDCSGLAKSAYAQVGINIPHQTGGIIDRGRSVTRDQLAAGDLVFPSSSHVGVYVGGGQMVHAPKPGDHVRRSDIYAFWAARRLL